MKLNCKPCLKGRHDECTHNDCLCEENKHGESLANGVRCNFDKAIDPNIFKELSQVSEEIKRESKSYKNEEFHLVADLIQSDYYFKTIRETKEIWFYSKKEGIYEPDGDTIIEEESQKLIKKCRKWAVKEVIEQIKRNGTYLRQKDLLESRIINTQNGILYNFELIPHSPEYLSTTKLPFSINHNARNLKLWNHILTIIDPKDINLIMELLWICISWNNPFKKMFVFKGETNTQKSTLADIIAWIIGSNNVSREKPESFLLKGTRFSTSKFIGKRINIASEIGNFTNEMLENQKSLIGAELQNTERKNDNTERHFDPTKFVFLYTTNKLGNIYSSINDNSVITRLQFLIFRNKIDDSITNGQWYDSFFKDEQDKQSAIDTIVSIVINYKKAQQTKRNSEKYPFQIPKTQWTSIEETKRILKEEMPIEDKYFADGRIIKKDGSRLTLEEIKEDFESFTGLKINNQAIGIILKKNGIESKSSNSKTIYKGYDFNTAKDQTVLN